MPSHKNDFLHIMQERGFVHQCTDTESLQTAMKQPIAAYIGFDCTASSLHVGSLMQIMVLRWLQKCGHRPIVLMGGGTTKIGDPSGKDEARRLLDETHIEQNMQGIKQVFKKYLKFEGEDNNALMINNAEWLDELPLIEFMRNYGQHFSVNRMLTMDSVRLRLERDQHLSLLEFIYMAMQAYDFVELKKRYDCSLQIGGSDQWGNIVMGCDLWQKYKGSITVKLDSDFAKNSIFGLTTPLITTSSGSKMGKTASGAVWLNKEMLPVFDYWQFWRNTEDADVGRFLRFFTELPIAEIEKLEALQGAEINEAKKILANEATKLCHGEEATKAAAETARTTFEQGGTGGALPEIGIHISDLEQTKIGALLVSLAFAESNGDAKKLVAGGGVRLNDQTVSDANRIFVQADFTDGVAKLSKGKKHHARILLIK